MGFSDELNRLYGQCILVTGASGFVGSRLLTSQDALVQHVHFRAISRRSLEKSLPNVEQLLIADISEKSDWSGALAGVDVVVHLAARVHVMDDRVSNPLEEYRSANVMSTLNLARQAARAGVKRFIFLSSIKVNGEKTDIGKPFTEESKVDPIDPYGISKLEAEEGIREICKVTGMEYVFIRPPLIYGPGVKANFLKLMELVKMHIPLPLKKITNRRSFLALDNLINFILLAARHPLAANQLFLLADNSSMSTPFLMEQMARSMGYSSARLFSTPIKLFEIIARCSGRSGAFERLTDSLEVDSKKARQLLEWQQPLSTQDAIRLTVNDFLLRHKRR